MSSFVSGDPWSANTHHARHRYTGRVCAPRRTSHHRVSLTGTCKLRRHARCSVHVTFEFVSLASSPLHSATSTPRPVEQSSGRCCNHRPQARNTGVLPSKPVEQDVRRRCNPRPSSTEHLSAACPATGSVLHKCATTRPTSALRDAAGTRSKEDSRCLLCLKKQTG